MKDSPKFAVASALLAVSVLCSWPVSAQVPGNAEAEQQAAPPRGLADSQVSLQNGAFTSNISLDVPAFRTITPRLQLNYSSSSDNGFVGVGWDLGGFSTIDRASPGRGSPAIHQPTSGATYLLDGEELIPSTALGGTHATLRQSYLRIKGTFTSSDSATWIVTKKDGTVLTYSPVVQAGADTLRWGLTKVRDTHGNEVNYTWFCDKLSAVTQACYPAGVSYAGVTVTLNRELRPDYGTSATGANLASQRFRLKSIAIAVNGSNRSRYDLTYATSVRTGRSLLTKVQQLGKDGVTGLPPVTIAYSDTASGFNNAVNLYGTLGLGSVNWMNQATYLEDFNGDGRKDMLVRSTFSPVHLLYADGAGGFTNAVDISNSYGLTQAHWTYGVPIFGDFNGDGRTDIILRSFPIWVTSQPNPWKAYLLLAKAAGGFEERTDITNSFGFNPSHWAYSSLIVGEFNGDGKNDLLLQYKPAWNTNLPNPTRAYILYGTTSGFDNTSVEDVTSANGLTPAYWRAYDLLPADFNGDGLTDLFLQPSNIEINVADRQIMLGEPGNMSSPFSSPEQITNLYGVSRDQWWNTDLYTGDFNGDRRTDLFFHEKGASSTTYTGMMYSQGGSRDEWMFSPIEDISNSFGMTADSWRSSTIAIGDFNGDHKSDIVARRTTSIIDDTFVLFSGGSTFQPAVNASALYGVSASVWSSSIISVGDIDGDGDDDLFLRPWTNRNTTSVLVLSASGATSNVASTLSNGYGGTTTIVYEPSSRWINSNNPPITQTVSAFITADGRGWSSTTVYDYAGAAWDGRERRHLGFRWVKVIDSTDAYKESYFYQGASFNSGEIEDYYEKNANGQTMRRTYRTLTGSSSAPWIRNLTQEDAFEYNGDTTYKQKRTTYGYDGFGNVTTTMEMGDLAVTGDERTTISYFYPNNTTYIVGYPSNTSVRQGANVAGAILSQVLVYYDSAALTTTPPTKGDVTLVQHRKTAAGAFTSASYGYDSYGNRTSETDNLGNATTAIWSTPYALFPSSKTNALLHTTTYTWDAVCGAPATESDPNAAVTAWTYDIFCRKAKESRADGGHTEWFYNNLGTVGTQHVREETRDGTADDLWKLTYFDGLGRTYKTLAEGDRTVETLYDSRGSVASVSAPYATGEAKKQTTYLYDAIGRTTRITHPDLSTQQFLYGDWSTTTCDELGKPRSSYRDAYDQVHLVREYTGKTCVLDPVGTLGVDLFETSIRHDLLGQQIGVTDSKGHVTTSVYDMLGRRTQNNDPDMGAWSYGYDDNGNLTSQTDAKAVTLQFTYDVLSRMTLKKVLGGATLSTYYYDEPDHGYGIGRRSRVSYHRGTLWYNYDAVGRVTDQYRQIGLPIQAQIAGAPPPGSINLYRVSTAYDYAGRVKTLTYPTGEVVTNGYDVAGRLVSVGGYVNAATYDARDNLLTRTLANGIVETFTYDPNRFWLTRNKADKGSTLHNVSYGRNLRGEVASRANALVAQDQWTFGYDDLRRLTTATSTGNAAWSQTFAYDSIGRMTSQTGVGDYSYSTQGVGKPVHAPFGIGKKSFPPSPMQVFSYDANGRLTSGGGSTITYNYEGQPSVINGVSHGYDSEGELVTSNSLRFMSNLYEEDTEFTIKTNYYYFGETRIARKRNSVVHYYLGDQIGSASAMTDSAGAIVKRKVFSPYGKLLWQSGTLNNDIFGLAGQRLESSGLYEMGARRMTPSIAMFVMPDPSKAARPDRPQTLNRFAYANNSPTNLIDPTGYEAQEPEDGAGILNDAEFNGSIGDPVLGATAVRESEEALNKSGIYDRIAQKEFRKGEALAEAWGEVVFPVARNRNVELAAYLYLSMNTGAFALGPTGSSGAATWVDLASDLSGLSSAGSYGNPYGVVHTHPKGNFLSMGDRVVINGKTTIQPKQAFGHHALGGYATINIDAGDIMYAWNNKSTIYVYGDNGLRRFSHAHFMNTTTAGGGQWICRATVPMQC